jgi:hypothetical protein
MLDADCKKLLAPLALVHDGGGKLVVDTPTNHVMHASLSIDQRIKTA